jgi:hypothetical protein
MKNTPLLSLLADAFDQMFVVDKHGQIVFFPWGEKKQGYLVKNRTVAAKVKKFLVSSFLICLAAVILGMSLFHDFWGIIGSMLACFAGWYLAYYLYTSKIVKSLPVSKVSYTDIVLEKIEPDDMEEVSQPETQFPVRHNPAITQPKRQSFAGIKRIYYFLSPAQLFVGYFFIGVIIVLIWTNNRPLHWKNADYLIGFFVCLLWGYAAFVTNQNMGSMKSDWFGFFRWKLPMIVIMVGFWGLAAWLLYKFMIMIIA